MMHKHELGDKVDFVRTSSATKRSSYTITRLMPEGRDGEPQYRIKSDDETMERVVTQAEVEACGRSSLFNA